MNIDTKSQLEIRQVILYEDYLSEEQLKELIYLIRVRLDLNKDDDRYDDYIKKSINDNLLKISRFPFPLFRNQMFRSVWRYYNDYYPNPDFNQPDSGYYFPFTLLKHVHTIRTVYFKVINYKVNKDDETKVLCYDQSIFDRMPLNGRLNNFLSHDRNNTEYPSSYCIVGEEIFLDKLFLTNKGDEYFTDILGDGLPSSVSTFMRNCSNLLVLMVLRDMYRDILKSPELYSLVDSSFNDEYQSLMEKDLTKYPKIINNDKTYW